VIKRVLVVDDEFDVQPLFQQRFRREIRKGTVDLAFSLSAEEALTQINNSSAETAPELVLSDINMPGMDGLEFLRILKSNFADVKVIMVTAYHDDQTYQMAMNYGADGYINKPIEFDSLKQTIMNL
jgi:CheY-like chemotaxis protein